MTNDELLVLIDARAQADVDFAKLVDVRDDSGIAAALSAGRTRRVEHLITERGVISALGPVAGDAFLTGLYSFGTLPTDGWPAELAAAQPGIARIVSWLKPPADGVNLGDPGTAQFLGVMAANAAEMEQRAIQAQSNAGLLEAQARALTEAARTREVEMDCAAVELIECVKSRLAEIEL